MISKSVNSEQVDLVLQIKDAFLTFFVACRRCYLHLKLTKKPMLNGLGLCFKEYLLIYSVDKN
jgi:hypothetical protein